MRLENICPREHAPREHVPRDYLPRRISAPETIRLQRTCASRENAPREHAPPEIICLHNEFIKLEKKSIKTEKSLNHIE